MLAAVAESALAIAASARGWDRPMAAASEVLPSVPQVKRVSADGPWTWSTSLPRSAPERDSELARSPLDPSLSMSADTLRKPRPLSRVLSSRRTASACRFKRWPPTLAVVRPRLPRPKRIWRELMSCRAPYLARTAARTDSRTRTPRRDWSRARPAAGTGPLGGAIWRSSWNRRTPNSSACRRTAASGSLRPARMYSVSALLTRSSSKLMRRLMGGKGSDTADCASEFPGERGLLDLPDAVLVSFAIGEDLVQERVAGQVDLAQLDGRSGQQAQADLLQVRLGPRAAVHQSDQWRAAEGERFAVEVEQRGEAARAGVSSEAHTIRSAGRRPMRPRRARSPVEKRCSWAGDYFDFAMQALLHSRQGRHGPDALFDLLVIGRLLDAGNQGRHKGGLVALGFGDQTKNTAQDAQAGGCQSADGRRGVSGDFLAFGQGVGDGGVDQVKDVGDETGRHRAAERVGAAGGHDNFMALKQ